VLLVLGIVLFSHTVTGQQSPARPGQTAGSPLASRMTSSVPAADGSVSTPSPPTAISVPAIGVNSSLIALGQNFDGTLQATLGYRPLVTGLAFLPFSGGIVLASTASPHLTVRFGARPVMLLGAVLAAAGTAWLAQIDTHPTYFGTVLGSTIVMSIGLGLVFVPHPTLPCPPSATKTPASPAACSTSPSRPAARSAPRC
jgi:MFS family permease